MHKLFLSAILSALVCDGAAQSFDYDFESGFQGWTCDFADYTVGDSAAWHLQFSRDTLPVAPRQYGIKLKGDNYSDDLFLFMKRKLTGLVPNAAYAIVFSIDVATDMPPDGIGGSDLTLKAGATAIEPIKVVKGGLYRMNIDKANQSQPGPDMDTLGHINHQVPGDFTYHLVTFTNAKHPFHVKADGNGETWLIVGAESAFEVPNVEFLVGAVRAAFSTSAGVRSLERAREGKGGFAFPGLDLYAGHRFTLTGRRVVPQLKESQ